MRRRLFLAVVSGGACSLGDRPPDCELELARIRELIAKGELAAAKERCSSCLEHALSSGRVVLERRLRICSADIAVLQSKYAEALAVLRPIAADELSGQDAVAYWMHLGFASARVDPDSGRGARLLDHAEELSLQDPLLPLLPDIVLRAATVLARSGDYAAARPRLEEAIALAQDRGDERVEAMAIGNLAHILFERHRYDEALDWYEKSIPLSERSGAQNTLAKELGNRGRCLVLLGRYPEARRSLERALEIQQVAPNAEDRGNWLANLGALSHDMGRLEEAQEYYERALTIARAAGLPTSERNWLNSLAAIFLDADKVSAALRYNELARGIDVPDAHLSLILSSEIDLARIEAGQGRAERAEEILRKVGERAESQPEAKISALYWLADLHIGSSRESEAEDELRQAIRVVSGSRSQLHRPESKMRYLAAAMRPYRAFVELLMSQGRHSEALSAADSSRALTLSDRPDGGARTSPGSLDVAKALARSGADGALYYWLAPEESYLWAANRDGALESFALPGEDVLRSLVSTYQGRLVDRGRDPISKEDEAGRELYELLVRPAASLFREGAEVLLSPDGALGSLSFDSLVVPGTSPHYWIEEVSLRITPAFGLKPPSGSEGGAPSNRNLLLVGDPEPTGSAYPRLPAAAREIRSLEERWGRTMTETLRGPDASVHSFFQAQPEQFGFIHFAAHAESNGESPLDSAVVLSPRRGGYKLYARDILDTQLQAELVTLSACQSAGSAEIAGEGLVGFAWAFLRAGARNVIAGLWDVADAPTAQLMDHLYGGLANGASPARSLRDAKLSLIQAGGRFRKPLYWAPFQAYSV